jgi:YggT family protein
MTSQLTGAIIFLMGAISSLYLLALAVRLILAYERANYFNPVTRFIITITQPIINPLRRLIPNAGRFETSTFFLMLVLEIAVISLIVLLTKGVTLPLPTLFTIAIFSTLGLFLNIFFYTLIVIQFLLRLIPVLPL